MTETTSGTLDEKTFLLNALEAARRSHLSDDERDALLEFVQEEAPLILFASSPPSATAEREDAWTDIGYRAGQRPDRDDPEDCPF